MEWDKVRGASFIELRLDWTYQLKEITIVSELFFNVFIRLYFM